MSGIFDYLIIGQGIAGSVLSYLLDKNGRSVFIVDRFNSHSSSQVAAGLINPITGRRVVKSWMADETIPFAKKFYEDLGKDANQIFFIRWMNRGCETIFQKLLRTNYTEERSATLLNLPESLPPAGLIFRR